MVKIFKDLMNPQIIVMPIGSTAKHPKHLVLLIPLSTRIHTQSPVESTLQCLLALICI
jgi:hypothetical protein